MKEKIFLGLTEDVVVFSAHGKQTVHARIDTGAVSSSIDAKLAAELKLGPIEKTKKVKSANGMKLRPVIRGSVQLAGRTFDNLFTLADRSHMKYRVLIGQDILRQGFLIDPNKDTLITDEEEDEREDGEE